jgi:hypothetical protein
MEGQGGEERPRRELTSKEQGASQTESAGSNALVSFREENATLKCNFERDLFRSGTLDFNLEKYVVEANKSLERTRQWYGQGGWDEKRAAESFARDIQDAHYDLIWQQSFSGKVPRHWDIWYNVQNDFEKAREQKATLSPTLVDAGISHPHHLVANAVGKGQRLDARQIAWLFVRPDFPEWNREQIIAAQRDMGVKDEDIQAGMRMAEEVRGSMKEKGSGGFSLDDPYSRTLSHAHEK